MNAVKASVIVLNHNSGDVLEQCIASLLALEEDDCEVLLIDNSSSDDSFERARQRFGSAPRVKFISSPQNLGCAGGRNRGIAEARGEFICFVDSDAYAHPGWLQAVLRAFEDPAVGIVASRLVSAGNPFVLNGLGGMLNYQGYGFDIGYAEPADFTDTVQEPLFACGNGLCTRRSVLDRVGGFDSTYFNYYEDVDFALRARRAGYAVRLARDAVLYHRLSSRGETPNYSKILLCERNRIRTVLKHFPLSVILRWIGRELHHEHAVHFQNSSMRVAGKAWCWNLVRLPSILLWRVRQSRKLPRMDVSRAILPTWGYPPFKPYNLAFQPNPANLASSIRFGEADEDQLLYGWHVREITPEGFPFRWTDDLAGVWLRAPKPDGTLKLTYSLPPGHRGSFIYVRHSESGAALAGRLPSAPAHGWIRIEQPLRLPAGPIEVILQTPEPFREPYASRRELGVALRDCEIA